MRRILQFGLVLVFAITGFAQQRHSVFMQLGPDIVQQKLNQQPATESARIATLRKLFNDAGCRNVQEQTLPKSQVNLMCSAPGTTDSVIVIAAVLDYKAKGDEAALRWGDLAMLPIMAESLGAVLTRHKLVFVAFSGAHMGEDGAKAYLEQLPPEQRKNIDAIVAFDRLGRFRPVYSVPGTGSGMDIRTGRYGGVAQFNRFNANNYAITRSIQASAQRWNFETPVKTDEFGADFTRPFHAEGVSAITFTSPAWTILRYIGNQPIRDYRSTLDPKTYNETYMFLSAYLLHLDMDMGKLPKGQTQEVADALLAANLSEMQSIEELRAAKKPLPPLPVETVAATTPPPAPAQVSLENAAGTPVFRTTTRLVQVDVVVTKKSGEPIEGLSRDDFTVFQDGRPQQTRAFESHTARETMPTATGEPEASSQRTQPHVLGTYSNQPSVTNNQSWNIILLDLLNTPLEDQKVARNQLQKIAQTLPTGQPVALFLLTSKLVMVQAFTRDPNAMMLAVKQLKTERSQVLTTEAERQHEVGTASYIAQTLTPSIPGVAGVSPQAVGDFQQNMAGDLLEREKTMESMQIDERAIFTLDAFQALSRTVAGYPGRKNLIWLSGDFPIKIEPDNNSDDKWRYSTNYMDRLTRTDALLTESRVAVYPIDIRGMQMRGVDISTSTQQLAAFTGGNSGSTPSTSPDRSTDLTADQGFTAMNERKTMMEVADQTGGHAFINTNDFNLAIARAIEDGSIYYTIAYTPDTKDDKSAYHRIEVRLNHPDVHLSYRRGYYSQPENAPAKTGLAALQGSLAPGMPPSTMLFFTASVKPPEAGRKTVEIDYIVSASNITLGDAPNGGKHVLVDCMAVAYDKDGKEAGHASDTLDGTIPAAALDATLRRGLPASQELELKPGAYNLRLGVQDRNSQSIGTLTVPITVPDNAMAQR